MQSLEEQGGGDQDEGAGVEDGFDALYLCALEQLCELNTFDGGVGSSSRNAAQTVWLIQGSAGSEKFRVAAGSEKFRVAVDSGAATSIIPRNVCRKHPFSERRAGEQQQACRSAANHVVWDEGIKDLRGFTKSCSTQVGLRVRVGEVRRGLIATSDLVDHGFRVVHDKVGGVDKSHALHKKTGKVAPIERRGGVYEWELNIMPPPPPTPPPGFTGGVPGTRKADGNAGAAAP